MKTAKAAVVSSKRGRDSRRETAPYKNKKKPRVSVHDSEDEAGYESMICVEEEVNLQIPHDQPSAR